MFVKAGCKDSGLCQRRSSQVRKIQRRISDSLPGGGCDEEFGVGRDNHSGVIIHSSPVCVCVCVCVFVCAYVCSIVCVCVCLPCQPWAEEWLYNRCSALHPSTLQALVITYSRTHTHAHTHTHTGSHNSGIHISNYTHTHTHTQTHTHTLRALPSTAIHNSGR